MTQMRRNTIIGLMCLMCSGKFLRADNICPDPPATNGAGFRNSRVSFTTDAYRHEAFRLVLQEINQVAREMKLEDNLPLTRSNILRAFIGPYAYARIRRAIGNITTSNYCYYVSVDCKFNCVERMHLMQDCQQFQASYTWPTNRIDFKEAYQQATQWLAAASMDVEALNRKCDYRVELDSNYVFAPRGQFVPAYWVLWKERGDTNKGGGAAEVMVFTPTRKLLQLRVEDPKYILRKPLQFTNIQELISSP